MTMSDRYFEFTLRQEANNRRLHDAEKALKGIEAVRPVIQDLDSVSSGYKRVWEQEVEALSVSDSVIPTFEKSFFVCIKDLLPKLDAAIKRVESMEILDNVLAQEASSYISYCRHDMEVKEIGQAVKHMQSLIERINSSNQAIRDNEESLKKEKKKKLIKFIAIAVVAIILIVLIIVYWEVFLAIVGIAAAILLVRYILSRRS